LLRIMLVPADSESWPLLEMLLEVADSSITYRSRYFDVLQPVPVLDLLMDDEANPRSLAFQLNDLKNHCAALSAMPSGSGWPILRQRLMESAAAQLLQAEIRLLFEPPEDKHAAELKKLLEELAIVAPKLVVVMGEDALAVINELEVPLSHDLTATPGTLQRLTPSMEALYVPNIDDALDEESAKREFWSSFRVLGTWWADLPPY